MRSYASAYKMCVVTFPSRLNRTARSRRAGPRARRPPDQLAWQTLSLLPERGVSSYNIPWILYFFLFSFLCIISFAIIYLVANGHFPPNGDTQKIKWNAVIMEPKQRDCDVYELADVKREEAVRESVLGPLGRNRLSGIGKSARTMGHG